jgi:hypothetical protein
LLRSAATTTASNIASRAATFIKASVTFAIFFSRITVGDCLELLGVADQVAAKLHGGA